TPVAFYNDSSDVWIHHNQVGSGKDAAFEVRKPAERQVGDPPPPARDVVVEDNDCNPPVVPVGDPDQRAFDAHRGDALRHNAWLGDAPGLAPDVRDRLAIGASNVVRTLDLIPWVSPVPLDSDGSDRSAYWAAASVLGGESFDTNSPQIW